MQLGYKSDTLNIYQYLQLQERLIQRPRTLSRIDDKMSKWKDSVENQRRNVYNNQSMLS
jgi:hypothetical protein